MHDDSWWSVERGPTGTGIDRSAYDDTATEYNLHDPTCARPTYRPPARTFLAAVHRARL